MNEWHLTLTRLDLSADSLRLARVPSELAVFGDQLRQLNVSHQVRLLSSIRSNGRSRAHPPSRCSGSTSLTRRSPLPHSTPCWPTSEHARASCLFARLAPRLTPLQCSNAIERLPTARWACARLARLFVRHNHISTLPDALCNVR